MLMRAHPSRIDVLLINLEQSRITTMIDIELIDSCLVYYLCLPPPSPVVILITPTFFSSLHTNLHNSGHLMIDRACTLEHTQTLLWGLFCCLYLRTPRVKCNNRTNTRGHSRLRGEIRHLNIVLDIRLWSLFIGITLTETKKTW